VPASWAVTCVRSGSTSWGTRTCLRPALNLQRIRRSTVSAPGMPRVQRVSRFFSRPAAPLEWR